MRVEWYGQSAFALSTPKVSVAIDPFNDLAAALSAGGVRFEYPLITGLEAQLLLVPTSIPTITASRRSAGTR